MLTAVWQGQGTWQISASTGSKTLTSNVPRQLKLPNTCTQQQQVTNITTRCKCSIRNTMQAQYHANQQIYRHHFYVSHRLWKNQLDRNGPCLLQDHQFQQNPTPYLSSINLFLMRRLSFLRMLDAFPNHSAIGHLPYVL